MHNQKNALLRAGHVSNFATTLDVSAEGGPEGVTTVTPIELKAARAYHNHQIVTEWQIFRPFQPTG